MAFTYSKLAEVTVGVSGASSIDFNNIPQNYKDLVLRLSIRGLNTNLYQYGNIVFNGSSIGYSGRRIEGNGSAASSYTGSSSGVAIGLGVGSTATVNTFGNTEVYIPNYSVSGVAKSISSDMTGENNAATAYAILAADLWNNVTAISSINIQAVNYNFVQYSTATLYGVKAEV